MKVIETKKAPAAIGPYVQARVVGNWLFSSGQIGLDPASGKLVGENVADQAKQVLANLKAILDEAGFPLQSVVKVTIFLDDMNDFKTINEIYGDFWGDHKPARSTVEVSRLPLDVKVEMDVVACLD